MYITNLVKMKPCLICGKDISSQHPNSKYCGRQYEKGSCSWKVGKIIGKRTTIKERCRNSEHKNYSRYKDVTICEKWLEDSFAFVQWSLANGWDGKLQIDRIDNDRGYSPDNCRYVTASENSRNRRNNVTDFINKTRRCRVCKKVKPFAEFMISRKEVGGIAYECTLCRKEIDRQRYLKDIT